MKPAPLQIVRASSLDDVWEAFDRSNGDGKVIAGGQSLVALLNLRLATPTHLIDISRIPDLHRLDVSADGVRVGAMVTQRAVERDERVKAVFPILARAVSHIGHPQIRSRGTVGGNIVHADPASELPALALLADAQFTIAGRDGLRRVRAADFFVGPYSTTVADGEVLVDVLFDREAVARCYGFHEVARTRGAFAMAGAVGSVDAAASDPLSTLRVAVFGVAATPVIVDLAGSGLLARHASPDFTKILHEHLQSSLTPSDDFQATSLQRVTYAGVCIEKVIDELIG